MRRRGRFSAGQSSGTRGWQCPESVERSRQSGCVEEDVKECFDCNSRAPGVGANEQEMANYLVDLKGAKPQVSVSAETNQELTFQ